MAGELIVADSLSSAFPLGVLQQHMTVDEWWILPDADGLHPARCGHTESAEAPLAAFAQAPLAAFAEAR